ncbi:MAG: NAD-dependent deacylase [Variovorax sp.]|nr:MAG: NAD-dependent deacylase [Variovorax sp.]
MTEPIAPDTAIALIRDARRIVVFSGAGLSKASGIPTYRDADGLWMNQNALRFSHAEDLERDPEGFTRFWAERLAVVTAAKPNPGHLALARLQRLRPATRLVTQNVDGLLTLAGCENVLELHGTLLRWRCDHCGNRRGPWPLHRCLRCGGRARPDVVMFGEMLNQGVLLDAEDAAQQCDLFLLVGSTAVVYPAADLPLQAHGRGAKLVTLNMEPLELDRMAAAVLRGPAEVLLPQLIEGLV